MTRRICILAALAGLAGSLGAQDVLDLTEVRNPPRFTSTMGFLRLGYLAGVPSGEDKDRGKELDHFPDASLYYVTDSLFGKEANLLAYGGREGFYLATGQPAFDLKGVRTRLELWYRPWSFYREGHYSGDEFLPTHRYQGYDYRSRLGILFPLHPSGQLFAEAAGYWGRNEFRRSSQTPEPRDQYTVPEGYQVAGARLSLESGKVLYDRYTALPNGGGVLTLWGERETNDSTEFFGTPGWQSKLPANNWRAGGRLSLYHQLAEGEVLEVSGSGRYYDETDRVAIYDASKPIGIASVTLHAGYRYHLAESFYVMPFVSGQFIRHAGEFGLGERDRYFLGGGLSARWALSKALNLYLDYSYLQNESREPVGIKEDRLSEHRIAAGLELVFGVK